MYLLKPQISIPFDPAVVSLKGIYPPDTLALYKNSICLSLFMEELKIRNKLRSELVP